MNLLTEVGFCNALQMVAALQPGTGCLAAPVCGSWVFMTGVQNHGYSSVTVFMGFPTSSYVVLMLLIPDRSRGSTMRSRSNPMGDRSRPSVHAGNVLTTRTLILLLLCAAKGIWFVLEQPSSSLMQYHCIFQRFLRLISLKKLSMHMGDFGADTLKPTILYSSSLDAKRTPYHHNTPRVSLTGVIHFQKLSLSILAMGKVSASPCNDTIDLGFITV